MEPVRQASRTRGEPPPDRGRAHPGGIFGNTEGGADVSEGVLFNETDNHGRAAGFGKVVDGRIED